ncbi:MAG: acyl-CoA dehydrogenase family protein [Smithellaceae bacterium]
MERKLYNADHELFRQQYCKFLNSEVVPYYEQWEKDGIVPKEVWLKAGKMGYLCPWLPEEYGGSGVDFLYSAVMTEELGYLGNGFVIHMHNDVTVPYIGKFGTEEQKKKYLPGCVTGDYITAIAITEPDTGSDVQAIRTTAVRDGNDYILNGQKTFVTNGILNNLVIVAVKTDTKIQPAYKGISLFLVEGDNPGCKKGKKFEKMGWHAQDTAELTFEDCRVPKSAALLGGVEGNGFMFLMKGLQQERLVMVIKALADLRRVLALTKEYISTRKIFNLPISEYQNTRFKMAEMYTTAEMCQVFVDRLIEEHAAGRKVDTETAMAKYFICESLNKVANECLQFFGGYGYMEEYPICKAYRDSRVTTIFGGTSEVMKGIVANAVLR